MDLSKLAANNNTAILTIEGFDGEPFLDDATQEPVTITLKCEDSDDYRTLSQKLQNDKLNKQLRSNKKIKLNAEELNKDAITLLAAVTVEWKHIVLNDEKLECNRENAKKVYTEVPFVRKQVEAFVNDRTNFLGNS